MKNKFLIMGEIIRELSDNQEHREHLQNNFQTVESTRDYALDVCDGFDNLNSWELLDISDSDWQQIINEVLKA